MRASDQHAGAEGSAEVEASATAANPETQTPIEPTAAAAAPVLEARRRVTKRPVLQVDPRTAAVIHRRGWRPTFNKFGRLQIEVATIRKGPNAEIRVWLAQASQGRAVIEARCWYLRDGDWTPEMRRCLCLRPKDVAKMNEALQTAHAMIEELGWL